MRTCIAFGLLALLLLSDRPAGATPGHGLRSGHTAASDTLLVEARAGQSLIIALPDSADGVPVTRYTPLRIPALSWLVDRSFFWYIRPTDTGTFTLLFRRERPDLPPDTLFVVVYVSS